MIIYEIIKDDINYLKNDNIIYIKPKKYIINTKKISKKNEHPFKKFINRKVW